MMRSSPSIADISELIEKLISSGYDAKDFEKNRPEMEALLNQLNPHSTKDTLGMIATYGLILYDNYGPEATENLDDNDYQMLISAAFSVGFNIGLGPEHASALPLIALTGMYATLGQQAITDYCPDSILNNEASAPKELPPMEISELVEKLNELGESETAKEVSKNSAEIEKILTNSNPYSDAQTVKLITNYTSILKDSLQHEYTAQELLISAAFAVGYAIGQGPEFTNILPLMAVAGLYSDLGEKTIQMVKSYAQQWEEEATNEKKSQSPKSR